MQTDTQRPIFTLHRHDADGAYIGTSHFYGKLGEAQRDRISRTTKGKAVIRDAASNPPSVEVFLPSVGTRAKNPIPDTAPTA